MASAAGINLVQNGDFSQYTGPINQQISKTIGSTTTTLTNWTVSRPGGGAGLNMLVKSGWNAAGAKTQYDSDFRIWDRIHPGDAAGSNGFTDAPGGRNYIVADGAATYNALISQTIGGLTAGKKYEVSFDWATGQQMKYLGNNKWDFNGDTWDKKWDVTFGGVTQSTATVYDIEHSFSGGLGGNIDGVVNNGLGSWMSTTMTFTAYGASQVLSFLAHGSPDGVPPFLMLSNVAVTEAVPEPSTVLMLGLGVAGLVGVGLRRRGSR